MEIIRQIPETKFRLSPDEPNGANQFATHGHDLMPKDMFDAGPNLPPMVIAGFLATR